MALAPTTQGVSPYNSAVALGKVETKDRLLTSSLAAMPTTTLLSQADEITLFQTETENLFGQSTTELLEQHQAIFSEAREQALTIAGELVENPTEWTEGLTVVNEQRMDTPEEVMAHQRDVTDRAMTHLNEMLETDFPIPDVIEDNENVGSGGYVYDRTVFVETANPDADTYLKPDAAAFLGHELVHVADDILDGIPENIAEPIAFYIERELLENGDFYQTPEEELQAAKWVMVREARAITSIALNEGTMSEEEALNFFIEEVGMDQGSAEVEVQRALEQPHYQMGYAVGAGLIEDLWNRVQVQQPEVTEAEFLKGFLELGSDYEGSVLDYAQETYGIDLTEPASE
jgi:uncharacterized protein (DUF885 family)